MLRRVCPCYRRPYCAAARRAGSREAERPGRRGLVVAADLEGRLDQRPLHAGQRRQLVGPGRWRRGLERRRWSAVACALDGRRRWRGPAATRVALEGRAAGVCVGRACGDGVPVPGEWSGWTLRQVQVRACHQSAIGQDRRALDRIPQLAHVARPGVDSRAGRASADSPETGRPSEAAASSRKVAASGRMSSARSRSGGSANSNDVQAVEQVLAERALRDQLPEVAVGGGDRRARRRGSVRCRPSAGTRAPGARAAAWPGGRGSSRRLRRGTACRPRPAPAGRPAPGRRP